MKDSSGAVVPGAALAARNTETGQTRTAASAADGSYRFSALPVGPYEVRVEQPGFQTEIRSGLTLTVGQEAVVNFGLQVGAVEQTVAVTAEAPLVNTTSGSLGGLVDERKVAELPLNGRNYVDLAFLQPGVQPERRLGGGPVMAGQWFSSNGAPPRSNNYMLDGAILQSSNDTTSASSTNATLGVEGVREFRVISNSFSAEYGMRMGSQMTLVSKNGTNELHGSLFEYLRNSALDARNFFDRKTDLTPRRLPGFARNQFGASAGGPIRKEKTFFFATYESLRERLGTTNVANTIAAADKVDDGHLVPQIYPVIKPILALYPDPNLPNNQFTYPFSQPSDEHNGQIRVDQNFSSNNSLFARYTADSAERLLRPGLDGFSSARPSRSQFATLSDTHIFTSVLLNTFRFSYSRTNLSSNNPTARGPQFDLVPGLGLGGITISGVGGVGGGTTESNTIQDVFTWSDDFYYTRGRHSLKFGTLVNRYRAWLLTGSEVRGVVQFTNLANFLRGIPTSYRGVRPGSIVDRTYRYTTLGFYAQDDLRVNSNLTLNLGLRYEFHTDFVEKFNHGAAIRNLITDDGTTVGRPFLNPSLKNISPRFGFAWDVRGDGKTAVRGGFGLLNDVAGGFGASLKIGATATPPLSSAYQVSSPPALPPITIPLTIPSATIKSARIQDYNMQQPHMLQYNLTVERQLPWDMGVTLAYAGSRGLNLLQAKEGNPTVPQVLPDGRKFWTGLEPRINSNWTGIELLTASGNSWYNSLQFGVQKRMSQGLQFQSSFTWAKVLDETQQLIGGDTSSYPADPSDRRLERGPAGFDVTANWRVNAIYRLPQLVASGGAKDKLLNGWWMTGILSVESGFATTVKVSNNRSRSQDNLLYSGTQDRPDLVPGRNTGNMTSGVTAGCAGVAAGRKLGTPDLYYDPCAFTLQPAGFLGTAGRGVLRGPGLFTLDFSLAKDTSLGFLGEAGKLEFRAEFFNILNRPNFAQGFSTNVFSGSPTSGSENVLATAGRLTSTVTTSRQIQLALKLLF